MVVQVADPTSETPSGFSSGTPSSKGTFQYQFNSVGTFYYWSGYVDSSSTISFRGVINVAAATDKELSVKVVLNGFEAQKCAFPFEYQATNYTQCTSAAPYNYNWCSPSSVYAGQALQCNPLSKINLNYNYEKRD